MHEQGQFKRGSRPPPPSSAVVGLASGDPLVLMPTVMPVRNRPAWITEGQPFT
ncbi:hypothetical protein [Gordonia terrae]|uniref:hypothetical protein n=1 Tax=Gordonia terrae TaxID=2055 RepID=UPI0015DE1C9B|nr:hypothetical protein [Gordonia terrae]